MKCEKLEVWKISARLAAEVYRQTAELKDYGFKDRITRAALSIPSNIAEGMEKEPGKDQLRFLDSPPGSAAEFATQTWIGMEIDYIPKETSASWVKTAQQITGMLTNLRKNLKAKHDS
ncbi:four helix bundle protein [Methylococcus geothermalis]|uniref:Four helix bundle protein n=1 Tax=Methylococcus geothermalis TaxID=2681310 RepID=A0A858Q9V2_9GAMM|nr:four helix bundle protein [Methylococcus geothermalis]QJD30668.1 four helix bundle protein [Methylococcus geothermalis]